MSYKTILVHVDVGAKAADRVEIAARLAETYDAHLVGVHALTQIRLQGAVYAQAASIIDEAMKRAAVDSAKRSEAAFNEGVKRVGWPKVEWRASARDASLVLPLHARYADMVVIGQAGREDTGVAADLPDQIALTAGRPMLVVPYAGKIESIGQRVLVTWNASRESTRAVTDALPLLQRAKHVHVVSFNPDDGDHGDQPGADIGLWLARHGVKVDVSRQTVPNHDIGAQILSRAADLGVDLIVSGAYGHSRVRELMLGGVTKVLLDSMTVPVLMSH